MFSFCYCPATVKDEIKRSKGQANQLLEIPGASAVIVQHSSGKEVLMVEGSLKFIVLGDPSSMALLFIGESFDDQHEGFYYPLLEETPVCITGSAVLTMDAEDGDVFGIRLPEGSEKLQELSELLDDYCSLIHPADGKGATGKLERTGTTLQKKKKAGRSDHTCHKPDSTGESVDIGAQLRSGLSDLGKQAVETLKDERTQAALLAAATMIGKQLMKNRGSGGDAGSRSASSGGGRSAAPPSSSTGSRGGGGGGGNSDLMKSVANEAVMTLLMTAGEKIISDRLGGAGASSSGGAGGGQGGRQQKGLARMGTELVELVGKEEAKHLALKAAKYTAKNLMKQQSRTR